MTLKLIQSRVLQNLLDTKPEFRGDDSNDAESYYQWRADASAVIDAFLSLVPKNTPLSILESKRRAMFAELGLEV